MLDPLTWRHDGDDLDTVVTKLTGDVVCWERRGQGNGVLYEGWALVHGKQTADTGAVLGGSGWFKKLELQMFLLQ